MAPTNLLVSQSMVLLLLRVMRVMRVISYDCFCEFTHFSTKSDRRVDYYYIAIEEKISPPNFSTSGGEEKNG